MAEKLHEDAALIDRLGGSSELARKLGPGYSAQRVSNWRVRGIPPLLKYQRQDVFGKIKALKTAA